MPDGMQAAAIINCNKKRLSQFLQKRSSMHMYVRQLPVLIKLKVLLRHRPYNKGCRSIWRVLQFRSTRPPTNLDFVANF
jgi:hypothetical protein